MASLIKKCQVCNQSFNYTCGAFTLHLTHEHNLLLKDYVIQYELDSNYISVNVDIAMKNLLLLEVNF